MILVAVFLGSSSTVESIGSIAAVCTTVSFVPQLVRVWRRKSAHDISLTMFLMFSFGVACWLIYGVGLACAAHHCGQYGYACPCARNPYPQDSLRRDKADAATPARQFF